MGGATGQGGIPQKGARYSAVRAEVSRVLDVTKGQQGLFDGIDTSWARFKSVSLNAQARSAVDSLANAEVAVKGALDLMAPALPILEPELAAGCVAVFRRGRLRIRRLPFSDQDR